ncbi:MAG: GAF domain-containing protein, partial [Chloroflexi bacterium]
SLSGLAVQRQDIVNSANLESESQVYEQLRGTLLERGLRSAVIVPILGQNTVLGTINLLYKKPHNVSGSEHETFMSIAKTIGLAISNARQLANVRAEMWERKRAEDAERRRRLELEVLHQASLAMNSSPELDTMLHHIAEYAVKIVGADDAHVFIYNGDVLEFGAAMWDDASHEEPFSQPREDGITMRVARNGERIIVEDMATHPLFTDTGWEGAIVSLPLLSNQQVRGVLNVAYHKPHHFTSDELRALELLADQAASSLVNFLYLAEIEYEIQERIRAEEGVRRRNAELEMLRQASLEMTATTDIDQLSTYIVQYVLDLVHGDYVRLLLVDEVGNYGLQASKWAKGRDAQDDIATPDTVTEQVYKIKEPVIIPNIAATDDVNLAWGMASIALPMKMGETIQGILQICWEEPHHIDPTLLQALGLLVDHASVALSNVQQIDRIKREVKERELAEAAERDQRRLAEALQHAAEVLNSKLELDELFNEILNLLEEVVPYDGASIMLTDNTGKRASVVLSRGFDDEVSQQSISTYEEDLETSEYYRHVIETGQAYVVEDVQDIAAWKPLAGTEWIRSHICAPIISEDTAIGFINLDSRQVDRFTQEDADRLLAFANQAAIAIENARLVEELRNYNKHLEQRVNDRTQELNVARARLQAMIASIRDGVIHISPDGEILYMNPALESLTGYTKDEWQALGLELFSLLVPDDNFTEELLATQPQVCQRSLEQQGFWRGEFTLKCRDNSLVEVELISTMARSTNGENEGVVTVVRDISDARELARQRRQFITTASHELRTPVTNMKTRLFLLKHQPDRLEEHLEVMELVVERMQNLISHLFDITRFEQGLITLQFQSTDLSQFLKHVARIQQAEIETRQLTLNLDIQEDDVIADVDAERLEQVLTNLLDNAADHTPEDGIITLRLRTEDKTFAVIEVEDTGEGIDEALLPNIFQPFFRGEERKNQGAGLGLAIVKDIVEKHGGMVGVQSEVGKGTCFIIRLPLSRTSKSTINPAADEEVHS